MSDKPYIDASRAAELLGVTRRVVVDDVIAGFGVEEKIPAKLECLRGEALPNGICVVDREELEGEHLERHRARLSRTDRESASHE